MNKHHPGLLYIVATPIGNLRDMSARAIDVLKTVNYIAAEDTRHSASLLQHFLINTPMLALHEHNEREFSGKLLEYLKKGESIALISDAGTPLISDPGYFLVREARAQGIQVVPIPGCSAIIAALSASGLPTDRFSFEGFLPAKSQARRQQLESLKYESRTMVFYEAPHRVLESLKDMQTVFGSERQVVLARELTKLYETIQVSSLAELVDWVANDANQQRGEMVLVVAGGEPINQSEMDTVELLTILLEELTVKKAAEIAAKLSGKRKNELYQLALQIKGR